MFSSAPWITEVVIGSMRSGFKAGWVLMRLLPGAHPSRRRCAPPPGEVFLVVPLPPRPEERPIGPRLEGWRREGSWARVLTDDEVAGGIGFERMLWRHDGRGVHLQHDGGAADLLADRQQVAAVEVGRVLAKLAGDAEGAMAGADPGLVERLAGGDRGLGDGCRIGGADKAQVYDLDRAIGEVMAVLALVHLVEGDECLGKRRLVDRAVGKGHAQLVALADIAQVAAPLEGDLGEVDAVGG